MYLMVGNYVAGVRDLLQDRIAPFRYADQDIVDALNAAMFEIARIRPDIFLDLKYQNTLVRGDLRDGTPQTYQAVPSAQSLGQNEVVAIPTTFYMPVLWHMSGFLQLYDVADTQDQRGAAFMERAKAMFLSLAA
jgi:hypothetical protein